jgi:hypothetical protein
MDEARHNTHTISKDELAKKLIRRYELSKIEYSSKKGDSSMPRGFEV